MPLLEVSSAAKAFGSTRALEGARLSVEPGEIHALLGPNGAGKTTLVRAIAGRVRLDSGTIRLAGEELQPSVYRPTLGLAPQEIALYPMLTARENLVTFGRLHGMTARVARARAAGLLDWIDLADRADEPVNGFSGGMKRRVNLAAALVHEPRVVVLDEATVGVDPQSRERIHERLGELAKRGIAVLLTTHHLEEAEGLADRITILDHGATIAEGTLDELVRAGGRGRRVRFELSNRIDTLPAGLSREADGTLTTELRDVATDLARHLEALATAGAKVRDVKLASGGLHEVFLDLTGRALRE